MRTTFPSLVIQSKGKQRPLACYSRSQNFDALYSREEMGQPLTFHENLKLVVLLGIKNLQPDRFSRGNPRMAFGIQEKTFSAAIRVWVSTIIHFSIITIGDLASYV